MPPDCNNLNSPVVPAYPPKAKNGVPIAVGLKVKPVPSELIKKLIYLVVLNPNLKGIL